ncbi:MAG: 4-phosphoerythronate dehydrogenase [Alistipes sp.]|nr:4-phosphoerythronate dehydrogenase [Candidatus Alistipes equi]
MKIVCDDKIPFLKGVFEPYAEVVYLPGVNTTKEIVKDADAIITRTRTICNRELLDGSKVKVIASATIGYDHIDTAWCERNGIRWSNAPGCNSSSVAQYIASALVFLKKKYRLQLEGLTLGIVGVGHVGKKVKTLSEALKMKILLCDPPRERAEGYESFCSINEIIDKADIITLHTPLIREGQDATYHLFGPEQISRLKPEQILINASRGEVVDSVALNETLKKKEIRGAILDVWEGEPEINRELLDAVDIGTPHIAGYSLDGKANGTTASVRLVSQILNLPLKEWSPKEIPQPSQGDTLEIDCNGKSCEDVLCEAIQFSYDITNDGLKLKAEPTLFEYLRGNYPTRREAQAFRLILKNSNTNIEVALRSIGFNIKIA